METFKSKYIIIYANWKVWQSNNESLSISKLDSDEHIITWLVRDSQWLYSTTYNPLDSLSDEEMCETGVYTSEAYRKNTRCLVKSVSIFDAD